MSRLNPPPFSRRTPSARHLKTGRNRDRNFSDWPSATVFNINFRAANARQILREVWLGLTMPSDQLQSNATGNGGLCRVDSDGEIRVNQGQRFQNENPISRSLADASTLLFFICQCVELSPSNYFCRLSGSLQLFICRNDARLSL